MLARRSGRFGDFDLTVKETNVAYHIKFLLLNYALTLILCDVPVKSSMSICKSLPGCECVLTLIIQVFVLLVCLMYIE